MTAITQYTENFTGGTIGSAVAVSPSTVFLNISGSATSTVTTDPTGVLPRMMRTVCTGAALQRRTHEMTTPTALSLVWFTFDLVIEQTVDANTGILSMYLADTALPAEKVLDVRIVGGATTLQLRDVNSTVFTSTALSLNTRYRVAVMAKLGATASARRVRMIVMNAAGDTAISDSGEQVSNTTVAAMRHTRIGPLTDNTSQLVFGRLRGDDTDGPVLTPAPTVSAGADQLDVLPGSTVTLTAATTGTGTLTWTQTSGPTVTLSGTGNSRTFVAPPYWPTGANAPVGAALVFTASYGGATDTVSVVTDVHTRWRKTSGGMTPAFISRKIP